MKLIPLTKGFSTQIDDGDWGRISALKWHASVNNHGEVYARRCAWCIDGKKRVIYLHHALMGYPPCSVDHKNRNTLDNQKGNLRLASDSQNMGNTCKTKTAVHSKYKGVTWHKGGGYWQAAITLHGRYRYLGHFDLEEDAARTYDIAARELFGEFARPNFPD